MHILGDWQADDELDVDRDDELFIDGMNIGINFENSFKLCIDDARKIELS